MSSKRMLGIAAFGAAFIALFIGVMLLTSYLRSDPGELILPGTETSAPPGGGLENEPQLKRVEVTRDNVQDVIAMTLKRPESYAREISIERFWDGVSAVYNINSAVNGGVTALSASGGGIVKHIIVTPDTLYVWNDGDSRPFERTYSTSDDWRREADEWQMLLTYEDVLSLPENAITGAGYEEYGGEWCIFVEYRSGRLGYTTRCYVSVALGLLTGAEEFDGTSQTYKMTTGACAVGEPDGSAFLLPDGVDARTFS